MGGEAVGQLGPLQREEGIEEKDTCVENILLYELEGPGPVLELGGEAVGQLGPLQLPLPRAQRRVNVRSDILKFIIDS